MKNKLFGLMLTYGAALHAQQLVEVDRTILSRALQREYLAAVQSRNQPPEAMKRMAAALTSREPVESRRMLLESVAGVKGIQWTAAHAEASAFGVGIGETVVEPKSNIHAVVERIYPAAPVEGVRLLAQVKVLNGAGEAVYSGRERPIEDMAEAETSAPAPADEGHYVVSVSIKDGANGAVLAEARNDLWVVARLLSRLSALAEGAQAAMLRAPSDVETVWLNTILGIAGHHRFARAAAVRSGWQRASPIVQTLLPHSGEEPLDPMTDIAWAEEALASISKGRPPGGVGGRWTPLAAPGTGEQGPELARVWWPTEKPAGIVLLLGDVLTHERSWDALRPPGAYVCIAPSFRRGPSWESVDGLVAAAVKAAGLEPGRLYMFAHGVGARDGLKQAAKEPARFGAVAAVAPLSDQPLTSIPKAFPPFLLMEAGKDGLIPEESLRRVGLVLERRLEKFEYAALPGVDHETAKGPALAKSLEFFRAIAAGEWKRPQ